MNPHEITVGEALQLYLRKSPLKPRLDEYRVQAKWEQVMGKTIARYTTSLQLIRRKLFITTPVASLKQELSYSRDKIRQLLNEAVGEPVIDEVIIQ